MQHKRVGSLVLFVGFLLITLGLASIWPPAVILTIFGGLYGAIVTVLALVIVRLSVSRELLVYRGYIGRPAITVSPAEVISFRFRYVLRHPWQLNVDFWVFELLSQRSGSPVLIPAHGWTSNRELFRDLRAFVGASSVDLDPITRQHLDHASR